jgi:ketosteroid isomerase-like protein
MTQQDLVARVTQLYQAFGRGDVPAILAMVTEDVWWGYAVDYALPDVPPAVGPFHGRAGVAAYFEAIGENLTVKKMQPLDFLTSERSVAVILEKDIEVTKTGKSYRGLMVHLFDLDAAGLIKRHVHFDDTASVIAAYRGR